MNYVYRRYHSSPMQRFRMNLRYGFRKHFRHVMTYVGEALLGAIWLFATMFFLPVFAAFFH